MTCARRALFLFSWLLATPVGAQSAREGTLQLVLPEDCDVHPWHLLREQLAIELGGVQWVEANADTVLTLTLVECQRTGSLEVRIAHRSGRSVVRFEMLGSPREMALMLAEVLDEEYAHITPPTDSGPSVREELVDLRRQVAELRSSQDALSPPSRADDGAHDLEQNTDPDPPGPLGHTLGVSLGALVLPPAALLGLQLSLGFDLSPVRLHLRTSLDIGRLLVVGAGHVDVLHWSATVGIGTSHQLGAVSLALGVMVRGGWLRASGSAPVMGVDALTARGQAVLLTSIEAELMTPLSDGIEWFMTFETGYSLLSAGASISGVEVIAFDGVFTHITMGVALNI